MPADDHTTETTDVRGRAAGVLGPGKLRQLEEAGLRVVEAEPVAVVSPRVLAKLRDGAGGARATLFPPGVKVAGQKLVTLYTEDSP